MSNKTRNRTEMMSITEYHNWDNESLETLEYCKKNLLNVLKKIDDGVVVKMKNPLQWCPAIYPGIYSGTFYKIFENFKKGI